MAYKISDKARTLFSQAQIEPNIVFKIDGIDYLFGTKIMLHKAKFDQDNLIFDQPNLNFDTLVGNSKGKDWISLSGTSDSITQQLDIDKGGSTSTALLNVRVIDFGGIVSEIISPSFIVDDILYRNAEIYLGPQGGDFDTDYILLMNGKITDIKANSGSVDFTVSHPDDLKRNEIFVQAATVLTETVNYKSSTWNDQIFIQQYNFITALQQINFIIDVSLGSEYAVYNATPNIHEIHLNALSKIRLVKKLIDQEPDLSQIFIADILVDGDTAFGAGGSLPMQTDTELSVESISQFLLPVSPLFRTYALINSELIEYTGIDTVNKKLTGCIRDQLSGLASNHNIDDEVTSFYRLGDSSFTYGNPIDLSLWIMLSGSSPYFVSDLAAGKINFIGAVDTVQNAIFFNGIDVKKVYGLTTGDKVSQSGSVEAANNFVDRLIVSFGSTEFGSYIVVNGSNLVDETEATGLISFKSQYNILPSGCGLTPAQVDVDQFKYIKKTFSAQMQRYDLFIKETVQAKSLINEQIFYPSGLYSLNRQGRVSVGITSPALYGSESKTLDLTNVKNPQSLKMQRSISTNFANAVIWRFDEDSITDKFTGGNVTLSTLSTSRIPAPNKAIKIDAGGIRKSPATFSAIQATSNRFLDRYQYGAEFIDVEALFAASWSIEIGDAVIFGDPDLKITDTTLGEAGLKPRIYEVQNKAFNWRTGQVRLKLVNTAFGLSTRYGVFSPSSKIGAGSTTTQIKINPSFGFEGLERDKWFNYFRQVVRITSPDYSYNELVTLTGFDNQDDRTLLIEPALSSPPLEGYLINIGNYEDIPLDEPLLKSAHCFFDPTLEVVSGISNTQFTVSAPDAAKLFLDTIIRVHNADYSVDSGKAGKRVTDITGLTITVEDLGFTPAAGQKIDLVGFAIDQGEPYVFL